jgi:AcrR family transcriptional regulator
VSPKVDVADERRAQIMEAALACFTRKGYNNTTMDDIAAESGLSKGTLYWYFKSKDDLFTAALMSVFNVAQEAVAAMEQYSTASDKLRAVGQATVGFGKMVEGYFSLLLEFWVSSPRREEAGQSWIGLLTEYKDIVVEVIEEGVKNGEFKPVDAEQLVWAIMAAYDGLAAYVMFIPDMDLERISQVFVETLLNGLAAADGSEQ